MGEIFSICKGLSCRLNGAEKIHDHLEELALKSDLTIVESCCKGLCEVGPNISMLNRKRVISKVDKKKLDRLVDSMNL